MTARSLPAWAATLVGGLVALLALAVLTAIGLGAGWVALRGAPRSDLALAALLCLGVAAVLGWAAGGWAASRLARPPVGRGPLRGLVAGVLALLLLVGLGFVFLREAVDLHSIAVALGAVDAGRGEGGGVPAPVATAVATGAVRTNEPTEIARDRTLDSMGFAAGFVLLLLGASVLGGLLGQGTPGRVVTPSRTPVPSVRSSG
ncbi:MAG: hypothetical protein AVDCRST_MAG19-1676 [uncultured Thermomicrobiales bacterium]|uniref:Uncharacterized protein n=1 Tax=uncultured Thermomicrobiales bacterium TaxID=1645740 RepID=A0A6J4US53_9BACT|nr:MAG: hypothetical protein AVDCRST_MAG19-1676 [uncultured Thermomicrobiales bacterium]